jgi:glycosyltransferase involved in cell wall biosynthesis
MSKPASPHDGVTVVIPAHNAADALDKVLPAWGTVLSNLNRPFDIIVVNDGSTDTTADVLRKRASVPHLRVLTNDTPRGFGACLRTALAETNQPLLLYAGVDYPYTPADIRQMLARIELRDEVFGKQPDLISGARAGQQPPDLLMWLGYAWKFFWRVFAGLPMAESPPWYGWEAWWYRFRVGWTFGVPLADVNSAFKLYRTSFLRRFPIQSDGDFVHTELVAKATFLTSIMDEIPITPKTDPLPPLGSISTDRWKVLRKPAFAFYPEAAPAPPTPAPPTPEAPAPVAAAPAPLAPAQTIPEPSKSAVAPPAPPVPEQNAPAPANRTPTQAPAGVSPVSPAPPPAASAEPNKSEPVKPDTPDSTKNQPVATAPPAKVEVAPAAPVSEPVKPNNSAGTTPPATQSEPPKSTPEAESKKAPDAQPEPNAGGLSSPGSPVPAT